MTRSHHATATRKLIVGRVSREIQQLSLKKFHFDAKLQNLYT